MLDLNKNSKVVAIIGGVGQIGSSIVKGLIQNNQKILVGDKDKKKLNIFKKKYKSANIEIFSADLTKEKQIQKFIDFGIKKFKKIDAAIHCSYPKSTQWGSKFGNLNEKFLKNDLHNQLGSVIIFCQSFLKIFSKYNNGNLILFSSIYGFKAPHFEIYKNTNINCPIEYSAIKAGIINITHYLAKLYKKKNIRINCISPGGVFSEENTKFIRQYMDLCNSNKTLKGNDISNLTNFLLSDQSKFIHGQNIIIDDGWTL